MASELGPVLEALYRGERDRAGELAAEAGSLNVFEAAALGDAERLEELLREDSRLAKVPSPDGFTALHYAAFFGSPDAVRALVAAGADPALKAQDGSNVLMAAASGARMKTFTYAFEIDPNVSVVTTTGNTIMHVAVGLNGRTQPEVCEVIQFLADHGAKLDELNGAGRTPIAVADNLPVDMAVDLLTKLITARGEKPKIPSKR